MPFRAFSLREKVRTSGGIVVWAEIARVRPIKNFGDALPNASGGFWDRARDWIKHGQHISHVNIGNGNGADFREDMPLKAGDPISARRGTCCGCASSANIATILSRAYHPHTLRKATRFVDAGAMVCSAGLLFARL